MALLDLILNLTGLLLWLNWSWRRFDPFTRTTPATIVGTVKRAEPRPMKGWKLLAGLVLLLFARALVYWEIGSAVAWTPKLDLDFVVLAFRSDLFGPVCLYSLLSFARVLVTYYFWVLSLIIINSGVPEPDPIQKLLRMHLGEPGRWPWPVLIFLPIFCMAIIWLALHPVLAAAGVVTRSYTFAHLLEQSLLLTLTLVLSLKYLLPPLLLLCLIASYVYLGASPIWDFVGTTCRNMLTPIRWLPLRAGKVDFAPVAGAILVIALLHWVPHLVQWKLSARNILLWPQ
jgi:uncharacterized protein YggT (Ycf19 family)